MNCTINLSKTKILMVFILALFVSGDFRSQRPNIIYIMSDDMGYGDLSSYGRKDYTTPYLDKLASQGIKFINAYSAGPLCTPTRTAFFTGRYPAKTPVGLMEPLTASKKDSAYGLSAEYPSVATLIKAGGYETALIGKWHLGCLPEHSPVKNGFDYFFGIHSGAADYISHKGNGNKHDLYENDSPVYPEGYLTDLFGEKAISFIRQKHNRPFFLVLNFNAPHWPWQGPGDKPYDDTTDFRSGGSATVYAAMMKSMDENVGKVIKTLDDLGISGQTMVIFTNDNGGERYSDNGGLSKAKASLWEGGIRVPAFVRWTGKIGKENTTEQIAVTMDWTATILSAAGAKDDNNFPLAGVNLMPVLTGKKKIIDRTIYWRTFQRANQKAIRMGEWKYLKDEKEEFLFNLKTDQGEKNNLKEKQPAVFQKLKKAYANWEKTVLEPIPL